MDSIESNIFKEKYVGSHIQYCARLKNSLLGHFQKIENNPQINDSSRLLLIYFCSKSDSTLVK